MRSKKTELAYLVYRPDRTRGYRTWGLHPCCGCHRLREALCGRPRNDPNPNSLFRHYRSPRKPLTFRKGWSTEFQYCRVLIPDVGARGSGQTRTTRHSRGARGARASIRGSAALPSLRGRSRGGSYPRALGEVPPSGSASLHSSIDPTGETALVSRSGTQRGPGSPRCNGGGLGARTRPSRGPGVRALDGQRYVAAKARCTSVESRSAARALDESPALKGG